MENLTVKQLKEVANQKGLQFTSKITKSALIELINGSTTTASEGARFAGEY